MKKEGGREAGKCSKMVPDRGDRCLFTFQSSPRLFFKVFPFPVPYSISSQTPDPPYFSLPTTFKSLFLAEQHSQGRVACIGEQHAWGEGIASWPGGAACPGREATS
jgi:hypothetical protein